METSIKTAFQGLLIFGLILFLIGIFCIFYKEWWYPRWVYPYKTEGLILSVIGVIITTLAFVLRIFKRSPQ